MLGMGWAEIAVITIVALLIFGPDKLPDIARQAGRTLRTVKQMADNAKNDLGREIGQDLQDLDLRDLNPREFVRKAMLDDAAPPRKERLLRPGEVPPFDAEAT
ncbi:twin arginine-targeting protein translocase TatB [Aeromicrobium marinum DSM 15272]|uniref:Twin arginine-targeting protein translocase TatB n=1 Tax=Aeromicrobium marinum DSM 15272 TaxID=585531 RepID=E2SDP3_9ACTN|nr:sec-independent translocase [Aeromicrobium marinum]EFQ82620.1 twin arginine-targeting protein translocase TatB [Aeromicrobium marinum DSM 15272]